MYIFAFSKCFLRHFMPYMEEILTPQGHFSIWKMNDRMWSSVYGIHMQAFMCPYNTNDVFLCTFNTHSLLLHFPHSFFSSTNNPSELWEYCQRSCLPRRSKKEWERGIKCCIKGDLFSICTSYSCAWWAENRRKCTVARKYKNEKSGWERQK